MKRILIICLIACLLPTFVFASGVYQLTSGTSIIRESDGAWIPADPANSDYQTYEAWKLAGNTPDPVAGPTLAQAQATKIAAIQAAWSSLEQSGIPYLGKTIPTDPVSAERIAFAVLNATNNSSFTATWLCSDGTTLSLTASQIIALGQALATFDAPLADHADGLIAQVNACTTVAAVEAIANW
jgi:hypothetical protein